MRIPAICLLMYSGFCSLVATGQTKGPDSMNVVAKKYHKAANEYFGKGDAEKCISNFLSAIELYKRSLNDRDIAICLHSIAFAYDELLHNDIQALAYAKKSLPIHYTRRDTLELGNMLKYIGALKGRMGMYKSAKEDIHTAIAYFRQKNFEPGVAVSYYDMALVFISEKQPDSAQHYLDRAKEYWQKNNNYGRIFNINNKYYELCSSTNQWAEAEKTLIENEQLLMTGNIYFRDKLSFYSNAQAFYHHQDNRERRRLFDSQYKNLKDSLSQHGIRPEP